MSDNLFSNSKIISWLQYFAENTSIDLEHVKLLDITRKNKNLIPTVEAHRCVLVFTEAGDADIFWRMYNAGLGDCTIIYNEGSEPTGEIKTNLVSEMIDRGINASAGMIVLNSNTRSTMKFGMDNKAFSRGSVHYEGSEVRCIILSKMQIEEGKNLCLISSESIAVEASIMDGEGSIIAVEYNSSDRQTMEDNIEKFGLRNITIIDHIDEQSMSNLPVPATTMLVASASMEQEMKTLLELNPEMDFVIYTLDFMTAAKLPDFCRSLGLNDVEVIQISVTKLSSKNTFNTPPAPWLITARRG